MPRPTRDTGFALVIALSFMAFLVLLLIALASMVRMELSTSANSIEQRISKESAILGLAIAVGELQKAAGPDQRITATNNILSSPGLGTQNITGVWSSVDENSDGRPDGVFLRWLISRQNPEEAESLAFLEEDLPVLSDGDRYEVTDDSYQLLVGSGSVEDNPETPGRIEAVVAQTIETPQGRYAWWIGDEGTKANLRLRYATTEPSNPLERTLMARRSGLNSLDPGLGDLSDYESLAKTNLLKEVEFALQPFESSVDSKSLFHDATLHSMGVLSDVRNGGLRKNLSAAFLNDAEFAKLLADAGKGPAGDAVFGPHDPNASTTDDVSGPRWEQIRSYFRQGQVVAGDTIPMIPPTPEDDVSVVAPVIAQSQLFVYASYLADNSANPQEREVVYLFLPAMVLWNPYNKTIEAPEMYVRFYRFEYSRPNKRNSFEWGFAVENTDIGDFSFESGNQAALRNQDNFRRVSVGEFLTFTIPATSFPPGTALIFTPDSNQPFSTGASMNNRLALGYNPNFAFYLRTGSTFEDDGSGDHRIKLAGPQTSNGYWELTTAPQFQGNNRNVVHRNTNTNIFGIAGSNPDTSSNLRPLDAYQPAVFSEIITGGPTLSWPLIEGSLENNYPRYGYKLSLRLNENDIDEFFGEKRLQWLGQHNPRASFTSRTPLSVGRFVGESPTSRGVREHPNYAGAFTAFGGWAEIQENFAFSGANIGFSDTAGGNQRAILFELPDADTPFVSIVQLGMTNFSRTHQWDNFPNLPQNHRYIHSNYQPAFPLGNSIPDGRLPSDVISLRWSDHPNIVSDSGQLYGVHHDISYKLNDALFDRFFLTSEAPGSLANADEPLNLPLANSRLIPYDNNELTYASLRDYDGTAANFVIDGSFNVNSTSEKAWASLIGSFYGQDVDWVNPANGETSTENGQQTNPLTRFYQPTGTAVNASTHTAWNDSNYLGYRRLDANEIETLAAEIVAGIRRRTSESGPFLTLADFINRNPFSAEIQNRRRGVIQEAIDLSGINAHLEGADNLVDTNTQFTSAYPEDLMAGSISTGVPGFLMQADLLAKMAPFLSARSDTFRIRSYGSGPHSTNKSEIWCEAILQRTPESLPGDFGRRFVLTSVRWLDKDEI